MGLRRGVEGERNVAALFECRVGDVFHAGLVDGPWGRRQVNTEGLADDLFRRVAEAGLDEAHALGELAEEPDVGTRLAGGSMACCESWTK